MRVRVVGGVGDLAADQRKIATETRPRMARCVKRNVDQGQRLTRTFAKESAGSHGKHYHKAITSEMTGPLRGEWGSDVSLPQGNMEFEGGSRNQPPHLDHARAADRQVPAWRADIGRELDGLPW